MLETKHIVWYNAMRDGVGKYPDTKRVYKECRGIVMDDSVIELTSTLNRLKQFDEDTQKEIMLNVADKMYLEEYGEGRQEALDRTERLRLEKQENGVEFELFGVPCRLNEDDREFFAYYLQCTAGIKKTADAFKKNFYNTVISVSEKNAARKSAELVNSLLAVGHCVIDALWQAIIGKSVYTQDKDTLTKKMEEVWLGRIAGIKDFVLADMYYGFKYDNKPSNMNYMFMWLSELRHGISEIDRTYAAIMERTFEFAVDAAKYVNKDGVLLNSYDYSEYETVKRNILATRVMDHKRRTAFIENMSKFPVYMPDYVTLVQLYGDADHKVESIMEYMGQSQFYQELRISLVNDRVSDISGIKDFSKYSEDQLLDYQKTVEQALGYYGLAKDTKVACLVSIKNQLAEIDKNLRTVRGRIYDTREEAAIVRKDYALLDGLISGIDFTQYDLLDKSEILRIHNQLLSAPYESDTLKDNPDIIIKELEPVLNYNITLQTWKKQLKESQEPWTVVADIINASAIPSAVGDKIQYWDFDGLKKYYPQLVKYERPVLFLRMSLLGWSQYFVLTNKRGLHITKNNQEEILIDDEIRFTYSKGFLRIGNGKNPEAIKISLSLSDNESKHFTDILALFADTLHNREEALFELPDDYYPEPGSQVSATAAITNQMKGLFQNKASGFFKGMKNAVKPDTAQNGTDVVGMRFCPQCGAKVKAGDRFCSGCGNKLK